MPILPLLLSIIDIDGPDWTVCPVYEESDILQTAWDHQFTEMKEKKTRLSRRNISPHEATANPNTECLRSALEAGSSELRVTLLLHLSR